MFIIVQPKVFQSNFSVLAITFGFWKSPGGTARDFLLIWIFHRFIADHQPHQRRHRPDCSKRFLPEGQVTLADRNGHLSACFRLMRHTGGALAIQGHAYANELQFVVGALTDGAALPSDTQTIAPPRLVLSTRSSGCPGAPTWTCEVR